MAKNSLPAELDLLVREFYEDVAVRAEEFMPDEPATARQLRAIILRSLLHYQILPNGALIDREIEVKRALWGEKFENYPDEWIADIERAKETLHETTTDFTTPPEARTGSEAKDTEVRKAILSKDIPEVEDSGGEVAGGEPGRTYSWSGKGRGAVRRTKGEDK